MKCRPLLNTLPFAEALKTNRKTALTRCIVSRYAASRLGGRVLFRMKFSASLCVAVLCLFGVSTNAQTSSQPSANLSAADSALPLQPPAAHSLLPEQASPSTQSAPSTTQPPTSPADATTYYHNGIWEIGVFGGGGVGLGRSFDTQFLNFGIRAGTVLTGDHGPGVLHGNFEFAGEVMPVYEVFAVDRFTDTPQNVYGVSIKPVILRWNFTGARRFAPYITLAGGLLFSTHDIPPDFGPDKTSWVNFTPQGAVGVNIFTKPGQALNVEVALVHHSSASLGVFNPGYNAAFFFSMGYTWIHRWRQK
jgi:lipid A 3-O-deacylase